MYATVYATMSPPVHGVHFADFARAHFRRHRNSCKTFLSWPRAFQRRKNFDKRRRERLWTVKSCGSRPWTEKKSEKIRKNLGEAASRRESLKNHEKPIKTNKINENQWNSLKNQGNLKENQGKSPKITKNHRKIGEIPRAAEKFAIDFDSPAADFSKMSFGNEKWLPRELLFFYLR